MSPTPRRPAGQKSQAPPADRSRRRSPTPHPRPPRPVTRCRGRGGFGSYWGESVTFPFRGDQLSLPLVLKWVTRARGDGARQATGGELVS